MMRLFFHPWIHLVSPFLEKQQMMLLLVLLLLHFRDAAVPMMLTGDAA